MSHTKGPLTNGWGRGVTGPTCPAVAGVTVHETILHNAWVKGELDKHPGTQHTIISKGMDTVAMIPTLDFSMSPIQREEGLDNARLFTAAFNSYDKQCGDKAIECAENDLLGQAIALLEEAIDWSSMEAMIPDFVDKAKKLISSFTK